MRCCHCDKENLTKNEVGLNKKLIDPKPKRYFCLNCLAEYLEIETEFLLEKIEEFKAEGCTLF